MRESCQLLLLAEPNGLTLTNLKQIDCQSLFQLEANTLTIQAHHVIAGPGFDFYICHLSVLAFCGWAKPLGPRQPATAAKRYLT